MKDYSSMTREELESSRAKLQRRLIPGNIIAVIVALVAAICQLFMPMIQIDIGVGPQLFASVAQSAGGEGMDEEQKEMIEYVIQDVDGNISLALRPTEAFGLGFSPEAQQVKDYIKGSLGDLTGTLNELLAQSMPRMTAYVVASSATAAYEDYRDLPVDDIAAVTSLINEGRYTEAKAAFPAAALAFAAAAGHPLSPSQLSSAQSFFNDVVDAGITADGGFSYYAAFTALAGQSGGESFDIDAELDKALSEMPEDQLKMIGMAICAAAAGLIGFTSALWVIMAVIALIRIFTANRRFTMWYVKLFCWMPCVLFVIAPAVVMAVMPGMLASSAGTAADVMQGLAMSFGGSGIVSGVCYALLWLVSIFWNFPKKRRIRKINGALAG